MHYLFSFGRTIAIFLLLWAVARLLSKHLIRRITLFDFISSITLGTMAGSVISREQRPAVIAASVVLWASLNVLFDWLDMQGRGLRSFLDGDPIVLVENGKVIEENLRRERVPLKQVESLLRLKGYFDLSQVEICLLETNGEISVRAKSQFRPVQPADLGLSTRYEAFSTQVLQEGRPLTKELEGLGLSEAWLEGELARQRLGRPEELFAAWLTSDGRLVVDRYGDQKH